MNNKKRLSVQALLAMTALGTTLMVANCGDEQGKLEEKDITIGRYSLVDAKNFGYLGGTNNLTVSRDGKNVYVTAGAGRGLFHNDGTDLKKGWTPIKLQTGLDGTVGKAKLETASTVRDISAANDGALVSVNAPDDHPAIAGGGSIHRGAFYISGKDQYKAAWAVTATDLNARALNAAAALPAAGSNQLAANYAITGTIITDKNKKDVPYFLGWDATPITGGPNWSFRFIAMTKADLTPAIASNKVGGAVANQFQAIPKLVSGGEYLFAVTDQGITATPLTGAGTGVDFPSVIATDGAAGTGVVGSTAAFTMKTGSANTSVNAVAVSGTNLFIGLGSASGRDYAGGVAVYEIKAAGTTPGIKAPDVAWSAVNVSALLVDAKGRVWALTDRDVIEAKVDGKKGVSYFDEPMFVAGDETFEGAKAGFKRETLPDENFIGAAFVKDKLVLSTSKGLYVPTDTHKKIRSGKVATTN